MGEVIYIADYLERKAQPTREDISKRLGEIGLQQLLLASEKSRLQSLLQAQQEQVDN